MTLNNAQKTASSSSVKTILGKTFAGNPVNACSVEPEIVFLRIEFNKNEHFSRTSNTQEFRTGTYLGEGGGHFAMPPPLLILLFSKKEQN